MPTRRKTFDNLTITLDARPDRLDLRDLPFRPVVGCLAPQYPSDDAIRERLSGYLDAGMILDQREDGACTGFGLAATINYLLWLRSGMPQKLDRVSPGMLYQLARIYDEWPGEGYNGSSCRGALKGWNKHGVCAEHLWPLKKQPGDALSPAQPGWDTDAVTRPLGVYYRIEGRSLVDMQAAIQESGAIYVSCNVHRGWHLRSTGKPVSLGALPQIQQKSPILGMHAFALVGYNKVGFVVQNSWGPSWAASGFAILTYDDWLANGTDAWVVGLGVPVALAGRPNGANNKPLRSSWHYLQSPANGPARAELPGWLGGEDKLARRSDAWSSNQAYCHSIVAGNDGNLINRLVQMPSAADAATYVCVRAPLEYFKTQPGTRPRVVVYAHGGLNSEADSIERIRAMGPYFEKNGIYPVFVTWRSGWAETLADLLAAHLKEATGMEVPARGVGEVIDEAWDRAIEAIAHELLARSLWTEMKQNVAAGMTDGRDLSVLARLLCELSKQVAPNIQLHLVGHSAGAFVCGRLLSLLRAMPLNGKRPEIGSCVLYAPACDLNFAAEHYGAAIGDGTLKRDRFHIYTLSDERELGDTVGPYTKSLLYLISRALEPVHKTPLLGLAGAFDAARATEEFWNESQLKAVRDWQDFFWQRKPLPQDFAPHGKPLPAGQLHILDNRQVNSGQYKVKATHGCFDNSVDILEATLLQMLSPDTTLKEDVKNLDF